LRLVPPPHHKVRSGCSGIRIVTIGGVAPEPPFRMGVPDRVKLAEIGRRPRMLEVDPSHFGGGAARSV